MILRFSSTENFKDGDEILLDLATKDGKPVTVVIQSKWVQEIRPEVGTFALKHYVVEGELAEMNFS